MTRGLIIGYGKAGKRHGKVLDELGIEWVFYDPFFPGHGLARCQVDTLTEALYHKDFAVICTPPDLHLSQLRQCLDAGLPVLCEKPLCGLGQLAEAESLLDHPHADKVMVAYNWQYHPRLSIPNGLPEMMVCRQQRELPAWGLLLDHCSHDLDIIRSQAGGFEVTSASYHNSHGRQWWTIEGQAQGQPVLIEEWVGPVKERIAKLAYADKVIDLDPDPAMFREMWAAFLRGEYRPGLVEAIETQKLLERCQELAQ